MLPGAHTWSLTGIAIVTGVAPLWVWKRFSNRERSLLAKRRTRAYRYAMRLYADEPALVFRAQGQLLLWSARYLAAMLRPIALTVVPMAVLYLQLDNIYGHRALAPGEAAVATARFAGSRGLGWQGATLEGFGVAVETQGVRLPGRRQVCWRIRQVSAASGSVVLRVRGVAIARAAACAHGPGFSMAGLARGPSIEVPCPAAAPDLLGFGIDWRIWFSLVSLITVLALRKPFGVVL